MRSYTVKCYDENKTHSCINSEGTPLTRWQLSNILWVHLGCSTHPEDTRTTFSFFPLLWFLVASTSQVI